MSSARALAVKTRASGVAIGPVVAARVTSARASKRIQQGTERLRIRQCSRLNASQAQNVISARFTSTVLFQLR
ncbi:hypothetical protein RB3658 [Rhodopirellula baltica SH 1]|uniref:Uncharacterized protein n=1 Tax=Rhodopirellula baltica (strain DSM 10527 / NCIMB 13988 / SH1) TaxID=243090 RepID=Q7UTV8_RHOBA|nr:hypothetical protein RB3658 [Rhodopirellula baltica SH 1]